jgi:hypothetical protein
LPAAITLIPGAAEPVEREENPIVVFSRKRIPPPLAEYIVEPLSFAELLLMVELSIESVADPVPKYMAPPNEPAALLLIVQLSIEVARFTTSNAPPKASFRPSAVLFTVFPLMLL